MGPQPAADRARSFLHQLPDQPLFHLQGERVPLLERQPCQVPFQLWRLPKVCLALHRSTLNQ